MRPNRRFLLILLAVLIVVAVVRGVSGGGGRSAALPTSCTTPALALRDTTLVVAGTARLAITGPAHARYAAYLDVTRVRRVAGKPQVTTRGAVPIEQTQVLFESDSLPRCRGEASTELSGRIKPGSHLVTLFRLAADGSTTPLASVPLTIRNP